MLPCPWCTLQRLLFLVIGTLALMGALSPSPALRRVVSWLGALVAVSGIASALWQQFVAAASASCNLTLADRILDGLGLFTLAPAIFEPQASCADASVNLLGIPYALWSAALFAACLSACIRVVSSAAD